MTEGQHKDSEEKQSLFKSLYLPVSLSVSVFKKSS